LSLIKCGDRVEVPAALRFARMATCAEPTRDAPVQKAAEASQKSTRPPVTWPAGSDTDALSAITEPNAAEETAVPAEMTAKVVVVGAPGRPGLTLMSSNHDVPSPETNAIQFRLSS
jgi:hypothetical protein